MEYSNEDLKKIIAESTSLSDAARKIFENDAYSFRERVKSLAKNLGVEIPNYYGRKVFCQCCGTEITGPDRLQKKFCSHSCAATYNNKGRVRKLSHTCLNCGKELKNKGKFCSQECQNEYKYKEFVKDWKNGATNGVDNGGYVKNHLRRYLLEKNNECCEKCGCNLKNPYTGRSILQVHHKDGDCYNNVEDNLELLCPNCHHMTENFGSRNGNSTRSDKRTKYYRDFILGKEEPPPNKKL